MESILIVSPTHKSCAMLDDLLCSLSYPGAACAYNAGEARRMMNQCAYDLLVINTPLGDEFGHELALQAAENSATGVILLVGHDMADDVAARVEDDGILVVGKPIGRQFFYQALKMVAASQNRMLGLHRQNVRLQNKIAEIRLVDRAKLVLMQHLNMTEPQAHRYIVKQAMDMRITRKEVAQGILKAYE
ncbi:MAG: ANTAR domain-containing protein [Eubacteriales bacterium]|nr:ANTAR domain-containing protein [Eubacteriales bacterium]